MISVSREKDDCLEATEAPAVGDSDNIRADPIITRKKRYPKKMNNKRTASMRKSPRKKTNATETDLAKQKTAVNQLATPPSTPEIAMSSGYALREEGVLQDGRIAVARLPDNRKRKAGDGEESKGARARNKQTYQKLSTSRQELRLIDALGSKKYEEDDNEYEEFGPLAGVFVRTGLPREGLRPRGPLPAEKMKFSNRHNFAFKHDPFPEHKIRHSNVYRKVLDALINLHGRPELGLEIDSSTELPAHAGEHVTAHAIIKVIMSQNTTNVNAEVALEQLRAHFTYGEEERSGRTPNYHKARTCPLEELQEVIKRAGMWRKRGKAIQGFLEMLYRENLKHLGLEDGSAEAIARNGQETPEAVKDFVEGLLSVDWLKETRNMQELFDKLSRFELLGVKTIMCIMGFNLHLPCFAVDTHVYRISDMLNWFPHGAHVNKAAMHMDFRIPNEIKYELHQAFWHHGRVCLRCKGGTNEKTVGYKEAKCPIKRFKVRDWDWDRKLVDKVKPPKRETVGGDYVDEPDADNALGLEKATNTKANVRVKKMPKPATPKKEKELDEEQLRKGYFKLEVDISDNFGISRPDNIGKKIVWVPRVRRNAGTNTVTGSIEAVEAATVEDPALTGGSSSYVKVERRERSLLRLRGAVIRDGRAVKMACSANSTTPELDREL